MGYLLMYIFIELHRNAEYWSAGAGGTDRPVTRLKSAAQRLGQPDEERYAQGDRNRCANGCGRTDVGRGIG